QQASGSAAQRAVWRREAVRIRCGAGTAGAGGVHSAAGDEHRQVIADACGREQHLNSASSDCLVEVDSLRKQFGPVLAVRDLSLRIPRGGELGLLGPNGSGKTTTIGLVLGLIRPTSGSIRLVGDDVRTTLIPALHRIGAMVESPAFYPDLAGRANPRFFQGIGK